MVYSKLYSLIYSLLLVAKAIVSYCELLCAIVCSSYINVSIHILNHWLLELFAKNAFFGHFGSLRLDLGQISLNLVENALATRQLAPLATRIMFYDILARACAEIKDFSIFDFFFLFPFSSFFSFLFAAVIELLLGLLAVKETWSN